MASNIIVALKRSSDFDQLKKQGTKLRLAPWLLLIFLPKENQISLGFSLSSRYINSVKRNRLKRIARESLRKLSQEYVVGGDFHLIVTRKISPLEWSEFDRCGFFYFFQKIKTSLVLVSK